MAVAEDDRDGIRRLFAQASVPGARGQTMTVRDPEPSARQLDGRRFREPVEYRTVRGRPVPRRVVIAGHGHYARLIRRERLDDARGSDIARVYDDIADPCDIGDAGIQPAMGIGEEGDAHGSGHQGGELSGGR